MKKNEISNLIINTKDITRVFNPGENEVRALRGVSLEIYDGEFVSLMGSSGSGKSTLLNILGCLDQPTSGIYLLDGKEVSGISKSEISKIRNRKFGFVFQSYNLLPNTTALENVELPLLYNPEYTLNRRRRKAEDAIEKVGLTDRMYHKTNELSGGQQQRVAIARALVNDPLVIFADEPTGNLDSKTSYQVMNIFQELNDKGILIVMVTHEHDIVEFSKRKIVLHDGRIIDDVLIKNPISAYDKYNSMEEIDEIN